MKLKTYMILLFGSVMLYCIVLLIDIIFLGQMILSNRWFNVGFTCWVLLLICIDTDEEKVGYKNDKSEEKQMVSEFVET